MGAWGTGIFDNDDARDYANGIIDGRGIGGLERTLDRVLGIGAGYLEAPDSSEALAAADMIACLLGRPGDVTPYSEKLDAWVKKVKTTPGNQLLDKARQAVNRVLTEPSELLELWQESDEFEIWKTSIEALSKRLI
jgi:hypothetical protein